MTSPRKTTFATKEEWQEEMARLRAERERLGGCPHPTTNQSESRAQKLIRKSSERSFAAEIEQLKKRADTICFGVSPDEVASWPNPPRYLQGGIVQKMSPDDGVAEVTYTLDDVLAWRAYASELDSCRDALRCGNCYSIEPKAPLKRMARCGACRRVRYCSRECQKEDYPRHRNLCKKMASKAACPRATHDR